MKTKIFKEMIKEAYSDLEGLVSNTKDISVSAVRETSKAAGYLGIKAMYPILGNLSNSLQNRIERRLGSEVYNGGKATLSSIIANMFAYPIGTGIASYYLMNDSYSKPTSIAMNVFAAFFCGSFEGIYRGKTSTEAGEPPYQYKKEKPEPIASFLGKIISLPIDYVLNLYDRVTTKLWKEIREEKERK